MSVITIVLADDHAVLRDGLRSVLERERDFVVVGEAADGAATIELVARLRPRVLLVDLQMPELSGLSVIRHVVKHAPSTAALVLSMHAEAAYVREALRAGALGYVIKEASASELVTAVRETAHGRRYFSQALTEQVLASPLPEIGMAINEPYDLLTDSERAVLTLVAQGYTAAEIAGKLAFSVRTVETYRSNLLHKLDLKNTAELVRYAIKYGLIGLD
ncbi:MAG TPA: response regulator transcription factor [Roseiflexaceae bacterium]|nr:response regulator transcription factor [Roseiflexaceae bacterium]